MNMPFTVLGSKGILLQDVACSGVMETQDVYRRGGQGSVAKGAVPFRGALALAVDNEEPMEALGKKGKNIINQNGHDGEF